MREITADETLMLRECLKSLAAHHNAVSVNFSGDYPSCPYDATLAMFSEAMRSGRSRIAIAEEGGKTAGFCKVDAAPDGSGKLDYLIVLAEFRGHGHGGVLMDWAMETFRALGVSRIEVKVVDGNAAALRLYEEYGFKMNAHILVRLG